jgi:hypothetical protein
MLSVAACVVRRRALAALLQQQQQAPAAVRALAIVRRSGGSRAPADAGKAAAPLPPTWRPVKDKETGCEAPRRLRALVRCCSAQPNTRSRLA